MSKNRKPMPTLPPGLKRTCTRCYRELEREAHKEPRCKKCGNPEFSIEGKEEALPETQD